MTLILRLFHHYPEVLSSYDFFVEVAVISHNNMTPHIMNMKETFRWPGYHTKNAELFWISPKNFLLCQNH